MFEFPAAIQVPLAEWIDAVIQWLLTHWGPFFDIVNGSVLTVLTYIERLLIWLPWWVVVLVVGLIAWRVTRLWWAGLLMAAFLVLIGSFGYWEITMTTLALVIAAVIISLALGILTGIIMARNNVVQAVLKPILDAMHKIPSFIFLILAIMFFGLGPAPAVIATFLYATPPVIRLTNLGIREAPKGVVEAAQAFGASRWQILFEIQWPLAIPSIIAGINQTTMLVLAMVVIASLIGAGGLGEEVLLAIESFEAGHGEVGRGFEAGFSILLLAIILDRITNILASRQQRSLKAKT